jgi:glycyl-tRNA synthetase
VTIDGETLKDGTVTVRERDSMKQVRVPMRSVGAHLLESQRAWPKP